MTVSAWRIVKAKYATSASDGLGSRRFGGRWNSPGISVVYTASSLSLCALENLVHLIQPVNMEYVSIRMEFDMSLVEVLAMADLPPDWNGAPPPPSTQAVGNKWVIESRSAVLQVPSVIIPSESNYLLNPDHPDFRKVTLFPPDPFAFDPRLL